MMTLDNQNFLENLQAVEHHKKRRLVFAGSIFLMIGIVITFISLGFAGSIDTTTETAFIRPDFSLWKTFKGGSILITQTTVHKVKSMGSRLRAEKSYSITPASAETQ